MARACFLFGSAVDSTVANSCLFGSPRLNGGKEGVRRKEELQFLEEDQRTNEKLLR